MAPMAPVAPVAPAAPMAPKLTPLQEVSKAVYFQKQREQLITLSPRTSLDWFKSLENLSAFEKSNIEKYNEKDWWYYTPPPTINCGKQNKLEIKEQNTFEYLSAEQFYKQPPLRVAQALHSSPITKNALQTQREKAMNATDTARGQPLRRPQRQEHFTETSIVSSLAPHPPPLLSSSPPPPLDWVHDMSIPNPECMVAPPILDRYMPAQLCPKAMTRVMVLSFFTLQSHGKLWKSNSKAKGVKNRICYTAAKGYRYVIEVVDDKKMTVPVQFYKVYIVQHYLKHTDYLVWLDYDLIVKNPHNWFEQYIDDRLDLVITDHKNDILNGAIILRNNEWGNAFMDYWASSRRIGISTHSLITAGSQRPCCALVRKTCRASVRMRTTRA